MPTPKRQSPRAAIKEWLAHTEQGSAEGKQFTTPQNKERAVEKERRRSSQRAVGGSRQPRGRTGELHQNLESQVHGPSEERPRDHQTKQDSGRNLADQLGLHAPFRSFATRGVVAEPDPARFNQERRKRRRTPLSTSSYLEPAIHFRKDIEKPISQEDAWFRRGNHHQQRASTDASSSSGSTIAPPEKPAKTYERKPRHKTQEDRYELKQDKKRSRTRKGHNEVEKHPNKKRKKRKEKSGAALMHDFSARNIESERLTLKAPIPLGLFGKGRASSPVKRRGLPDLTFSEINFLNHRREAPKDNPPQGKPSRRKRDKAADADAEISRFFSTSNRRPHGAGDTSSQKKGEDWQQDRSSIPPVDLPEKPFLGFGGVGPGHVSSNGIKDDLNKRSPLCQSPSSRSTTYFTWSQTNVSRRSSSRHASQSHSPCTGELRLFPVSGSPVQGRVRTSSTSVGHHFREESRTASPRRHHKPHRTSTGRNSSDPVLRYDRSEERGPTNVNAEECNERQDKLQETEHREGQRSHDVHSPKAALASLLAAQDRPELLGAVLDALLGRVTNNLKTKNEGEQPTSTPRSKSVDNARVSEGVPEAQMPQGTGQAAPQDKLTFGSTTANNSKVAEKSYPAPRSHQWQPLRGTIKQSAMRLLSNASKLQPPFSDAHGSRRLGEEQDAQDPDDNNPPPIRIPRVLPHSNSAWTGYRDLYQGQMGAMDRYHEDNIQTTAESAAGDYNHPLGTRSEAHLSDPADHLDRYHMFDEYQQLDADINNQYPGAEGIDAWDQAEPQLYDQMDGIDQQTHEAALNNHQDEQDPMYLEDTRPSTEHARYSSAGQNLHVGVETSDSFATPKFLGARTLTVSDPTKDLSPWSLRRHRATPNRHQLQADSCDLQIIQRAPRFSLRIYKTAGDFSQALDIEADGSRLRIVLLGHGPSWDVDRDMVDVVCSKYQVDPRFLVRHFDYITVQEEENCPGDIADAIAAVDEDYFENKYTWNLGGEVMSPLSMQLGSCFFFAYAAQCLSVAIHEEGHKVTVLLFLRACLEPLLYHHPDARATRSILLNPRPAESMFDITSQTLSTLNYPEAQNEYDRLVTRAVLPYISNLVSCCYTKYHREIAPHALKVRDLYRTNQEDLFIDIRQQLALQRELEVILAINGEKTSGTGFGINSGHEILRLLQQLTKDYQALLSFYQDHDRSNESRDLGKLMQAQIAEAREAKQTSAKLGQLSELAYIFLPLQLTVSAMGMNLQNFGTGNIQVNTFFLTLAIIAALSFTPMLFPLFFGPWKARLSQIRDVARYSRRAGFLYGWFCLCHRARTNDKLWDCGIGYDMGYFKGSNAKRAIHGEGWPNRRAGLTVILRSPPFIFFPQYWQKLLDELYSIIDTPQWGKKDTSHHTA
ncbi:MAG: hypothetical protein Q9208_007752 [Pyrenodesmia sp. 3 TL-2023]